MRSVHLATRGRRQNLHTIVGCPQEKRRDGVERHVNQAVGPVDLSTTSGEDCGYASEVLRLMFDGVPDEQHYVEDSDRGRHEYLNCKPGRHFGKLFTLPAEPQSGKDSGKKFVLFAGSRIRRICFGEIECKQIFISTWRITANI